MSTNGHGFTTLILNVHEQNLPFFSNRQILKSEKKRDGDQLFLICNEPLILSKIKSKFNFRSGKTHSCSPCNF